MIVRSSGRADPAATGEAYDPPVVSIRKLCRSAPTKAKHDNGEYNWGYALMTSNQRPSHSKGSSKKDAIPSGIGRRRDLAREKGTEYHERRRRQLLEAAARVFHEKGRSEASLSDIAAIAGIDRAGLYYYWENKNSIFAAVIKEAAWDALQEVRHIVARPISVEDKLRLLVTSLMLQYDKHYPYLYVYDQEDLSSIDLGVNWQKDLVDLSVQALALWKSVVEQGLKEGDLTSQLPPGVIVQTIIGGISWSARWYEPGRGMDAATIGAAMADLFIDGLIAKRG
jgi:TetR/AcrR family transcriptional regulator, cholesterol catabolism regulator